MNIPPRVPTLTQLCLNCVKTNMTSGDLEQFLDFTKRCEVPGLAQICYDYMLIQVDSPDLDLKSLLALADRYGFDAILICLEYMFVNRILTKENLQVLFEFGKMKNKLNLITECLLYAEDNKMELENISARDRALLATHHAVWQIKFY